MRPGITTMAALLAMVLGLAGCGGGAGGGVGTGPVAPTHEAGALDTGFSSDGMTSIAIGTLNDYANSVAVQPDGKIVVAGTCDNGTDTDFAVLRLNADGTADESFGTHGVVTTSIGQWAYGTCVVVQTDGKIVVAGYSSASSFSYYDVAVARYTSAGALDTGFGTGGTVVTPVGSHHDEAYGMALQSDGKIVVVGRASDSTNGFGDFIIVRYTSLGALDTGFGSGGAVVDAAIGAGNDYARSVVVQPDGKIVVAGHAGNGTNDDFALARYTSTGAPDPGFGTGGHALTPIGPGDDDAYSLALQADGKIVLAGYAHNGSNYDIALARYTSTGALDAGFGTGGKVTTAIGTSHDMAYHVAVQADGKIVVAGLAQLASRDLALVRYTTSGALDSGFGAGGVVTTDISGRQDEAYGMTLTDEQIVVAGIADNGSNNDFAVARYWQ